MMEILSFFLWIVVSIFFFIATALLVLKMAENDICFTKNVSGRVKAIVAGDQVVKWIGWIPGYHIFSDSGQIVPTDGLKPDLLQKCENDVSLADTLLHPLGLTFIGIWPFHKIYKYKFKWTEWVKKEGNTENVAVPRETDGTDHIRFRFPYLIEISEVETKGKVPINVKLLVTPRIKNASMALFKSGGEWLTNLTGGVQSATRDWVGRHELEEITTAQHESDESGFVKYLLKLNDSSDGNKGLTEMFGVEIDIINFLSYEIAGEGAEQLRKATTAQYVAKQEAIAEKERSEGKAQAIINIAKAESHATTLNGDAKAIAMKKMLDAIGSHPEGAQIQIAEKIAEAIKGSKLTTLVTGGGANPLLNIMTGEKAEQNREEPRQEPRSENQEKKQDRQEKKKKDDKNTEVNNNEKNS